MHSSASLEMEVCVCCVWWPRSVGVKSPHICGFSLGFTHKLGNALFVWFWTLVSVINWVSLFYLIRRQIR
jgi:hypothetical protein